MVSLAWDSVIRYFIFNKYNQNKKTPHDGGVV